MTICYINVPPNQEIEVEMIRRKMSLLYPISDILLDSHFCLILKCCHIIAES